ncbi:MAG: hypothetical protein EOM17_07115 [Synergistales bacterium]|nr:hypothetical protein [Synergistales bacterium]
MFSTYICHLSLANDNLSGADGSLLEVACAVAPVLKSGIGSSGGVDYAVEVRDVPGVPYLGG